MLGVKLLRLKFVLILSTIFSSALWANQETNPNAQPLGCVTTHYPPYTIFNEDEPPSGRDIGLLEGLANAMGWKIEFIDIPWGRLKRSITTAPFQCYFSLANIENRSDHLTFSSVPLHVTQYALFYRNSLSEKQLQSWRGLRIGGVRGITVSDKFIHQYNIEPDDFIYLDSNESLVDMLQLGRIDAFVTNQIVGNMLTRHHADISSFVISTLDVPVYLAVDKSLNIDMSAVDKILTELVNEQQKEMANN